MRIQSTVAGAPLALALATVMLPAAARSPGPAPRDIESILQAHCTVCHSPGGPSPMPLVTYEQAVPWAQQIKAQALARRMPIWHAARGYGAFSNDPTLSPYEIALVVRWADGARDPGPPEPKERVVQPKSQATKADDTVTVRVRNGWATGWTFTPGDPLITSATFTSGDGSTIGAWTAGDRAARLPRGSAIRVVSPVRVEIRRREKTLYETESTPRRPSLQFSWLTPTADRPHPTPARRARIERVACGGTIGPSDATLLGVRPLLAAGASAQVTVERIGGAQPVLLGWFREFDPNYARIYWLDRPLDFVANARLTSDASCELELVLSSRR